MGNVSGGSASGTIDYPSYMKNMHEILLNTAYTIYQAEATQSSPYSTWVAVDPNHVFGLAGGWYNPTQAMDDVRSFNFATTLNSIASAITAFTDGITTATNAHAAVLDTRLTSDIVPRYEGGMRDIGAVSSSAFPIGRAIIESTHDAYVADFDAQQRARKLEKTWDLAGQFTLATLDRLRLVAALATEIGRLYVAASHEYSVTAVNMLVRDRAWDSEVLQRAANILASISGSAVSKNDSVGGSALGGALSGALAGAALGATVASPLGIGAPVAAAAGGALGLIGGLFG